MRLPSPRGVLLALAVVTLFHTATDAGAAGMLVAEGGFGGELSIESQDVSVTINNSIAVT